MGRQANRPQGGGNDLQRYSRRSYDGQDYEPRQRTSQGVQKSFVPERYQGRTNVPKRNERQRKLSTILAVFVVVLIVVGIWVVVSYQQQLATERAVEESAQQAATLATSKHAVIFTVSAPGYDSNTCSVIPMHVVGTDTTGKAVDQEFGINAQGKGVSLTPGSYTASIIASPMLADGTLYNVPTTQWSIEIPADFAVNAEFDMPTNQPITFTLADMSTITDDQLDAAYKAALSGGTNGTLAATLFSSVTQARNAAQSGKGTASTSSSTQTSGTIEECHSTTDSYELTVPDSWAGSYACEKVGWSGGGTGYEYILNGSSTPAFTMVVIKISSEGEVGQMGVGDYQEKVGTTSDGNYSVWFVGNNDPSVGGTTASDIQSVKQTIAMV